MSLPAVTIVTPSYNQGEFIRATIESVLAQDYPNLEYIVMDGGSTDETAAIVQEYASRLTWISEPDHGQAHAINKGFLRAKGEIVAWLNSDDILLEGAVAAAVQGFAQAPTAGAVYGEGYLLDRAGKVKCRFPATEPFNLWKLVYLSDYVLQPAAFFRRDAVEQVGWLDESLHWTMDWDLLIRLGKRFGLYYVPQCLGALREYPEAKSFSGGRARIEEIRRLLERHTGMRRAPGYWTHALDQFQRSAMAALERSPRWLRPLAVPTGLLVYAATALPIAWVARRGQGCWRDGWAGPRVCWMLPEGSGEIVIRGSVPDGAPWRGQVLAVTAEGQLAVRQTVGPGGFEVRFPAKNGAHAPLSIEVQTTRWKRGSWRRDLGRRLAWRMEEISWAKSIEPLGLT